jgi:hypothetical protein
MQVKNRVAATMLLFSEGYAFVMVQRPQRLVVIDSNPV